MAKSQKTQKGNEQQFLHDVAKGTNRKGQTQMYFCRFSSFPRQQSIWEAQIFAQNRRYLQIAGNRIKQELPAETWRLALAP